MKAKQGRKGKPANPAVAVPIKSIFAPEPRGFWKDKNLMFTGLLLFLHNYYNIPLQELCAKELPSSEYLDGFIFTAQMERNYREVITVFINLGELANPFASEQELKKAFAQYRAKQNRPRPSLEPITEP